MPTREILTGAWGGPGVTKIVLSTWDTELNLDRIDVKLAAPSKNDLERAAAAYPNEMRKLAEYLQKVTSSDSEAAYKRNRIGFTVEK